MKLQGPLKFQRKRRIYALLVLLVIFAAPLRADDIVVRIDPRVEFFAVMGRLAGFNEYNQPGFASYDAAVDAHFDAYRTHPAIGELKALREETGVGFNMLAEVALALHPGGWALRVDPRDRKTGLDGRWTEASVLRFLRAAQRFWQDSRADAFFESQRDFYARVHAALEADLNGRIDARWLPIQYSGQARRLTVIPGLLHGPHSYGPHLNLPDGSTETYAVLATPPHEAGAAPAYPATQVASLLVHEMHHPYVNPWVQEKARELEGPASVLFDQVATKMKAAAYGRWDYMLNESLVRAQVLRYYRSRNDVGAYWRNLQDDLARGFIWVGALADQLDDVTGPSGPFNASAASAVVDFFTRWSADPAGLIAVERTRQQARVEARRAAGVRIVRTVPELENGHATPGDGELRLQFDRSMRGSVFIGGSPPEVTGKPRWDAAARELVIPVRFRQGETYRLFLNDELSPGVGFVGTDGVWLIPREWTIHVRH